MSDFSKRYGQWAIIAGASQGIGEQFSRQLAAKGLNLVMIARGAEALEAIAVSIKSQYDVQVETLSLDLAAEHLAEQVGDIIRAKEIGLLVFNAAYAHIGNFLDNDMQSKQLCIDVNCRAPLELLQLLLPVMVERKRGGVILMSSMSGWQGSALVSHYAATKAYNTVLAEGLWEEMQHYNVDVMACVAGATYTPNFNRETPADKAASAFPMQPEDVVSQALKAFDKRKGPTVIVGGVNRFVYFLFSRLFSRKLAVSVISSATRKMYER